MKASLTAEELLAIRVAEQAIRVLPEKPCLQAFPFLNLIDLTSYDDNNGEEEISIVSFKVQMHEGCFSRVNEDLSSWPKFLFHIIFHDDSTWGVKYAHAEFMLSESTFGQIEFNATIGEEGEIIISKK